MRPSVGPDAGAKSSRLLGVRAEPGDHHQVESGAPGGRRGHPVVGGGDVRPHALAVPVDERARIAAALRLRGHSRPRARRRRGFGDGGRHDPDRSAFAETLPAGEPLRGRSSPTTVGAGPQRRVGGCVGKGDPEAGGVDSVPSRRVDGGEPRAVEVIGAREVPRIRRPTLQARRGQQPGHVVSHAADRGERGQVGGALRLGLCRSRRRRWPPAPGRPGSGSGRHRAAPAGPARAGRRGDAAVRRSTGPVPADAARFGEQAPNVGRSPGRPARARRAASGLGARVAMRTGRPRRSSSPTARAATERSSGSEASRQPPAI